MKRLLDPGIDRLRLLSGGGREIKFDKSGEVLRIDLREDYILMWQQEVAVKGESANLLLACENSSGSLHSTRLTWIVGSAIRTEFIKSKDHFV